MSLDLSTPATANPADPAVTRSAPDLGAILAIARQRRCNSLISAVVLLMIFMGFIVLTTSTTILSGTLAGLGLAYWVGFGIFAGTLVAAQIYVRWARRMDIAIDSYLADLDAATDRDGGE